MPGGSVEYALEPWRADVRKRRKETRCGEGRQKSIRVRRGARLMVARRDRLARGAGPTSTTANAHPIDNDMSAVGAPPVARGRGVLISRLRG
jgi:hypothetical protein